VRQHITAARPREIYREIHSPRTRDPGQGRATPLATPDEKAPALEVTWARVMLIRSIRPNDSQDWERMRQALWPSAPGEHAAEIERYFNGNRKDPAEVLMAFDDAGRAVAFAELSIRPYAEGCYSGRVAYLEGWFVEASARGKGVGAALVMAAEEWARGQGCTEFASDTETDNAASAAAHKSLGFEEINRIICFRKAL
jgi:aminoglycoside 6'-N-acetyltransferase I